MLFKKNQKDKIIGNSLNEIKSVLEKHKEKYNSLENTIARLERIIKYSKDEPTFNIMNDYDYKLSGNINYLTPYYSTSLYVYIEKEEYIVHLKELNNTIIGNNNVDNFYIENKLIHLDIKFKKYIGGRYCGFWIVYKYIIDYKKGTYVYSVQEIEDNSESD